MKFPNQYENQNPHKNALTPLGPAVAPRSLHLSLQMASEGKIPRLSSEGPTQHVPWPGCWLISTSDVFVLG